MFGHDHDGSRHKEDELELAGSKAVPVALWYMVLNINRSIRSVIKEVGLI